jgi:hypothetical protein
LKKDVLYFREKTGAHRRLVDDVAPAVKATRHLALKGLCHKTETLLFGYKFIFLGLAVSFAVFGYDPDLGDLGRRKANIAQKGKKNKNLM